MQEVAISVFKTKFLSLIDQVLKTRLRLRVTLFGNPVDELLLPTPHDERGQCIGSMTGTAEIVGDIISPVIEETDVEALRD